ncbi:hypothetical protein [Prevotella pallens]|uniref:hypothetical protein n=1 Tax=Prevotella pallens TaxID=60133 RepID=UPI0028DC8F46|nr:hypothetical protein [Prevotella pallens]
MDKKKAEQAKCLLYELEKVQEIKDTMGEEAQNWWSFLAPDIKSWNRDGLIMPKILREEFTKAVDRSIERLEKQIEEL